MTDLSVPATDTRDDVNEDVYLRRYLAHAATQLPGRQQPALIALAMSHLELGRVRQPGEILVRLRDLDGGRTAVDVVTADAPYLVDSADAELERTGHPVAHLLHPQLVVCRDEGGKLISVLDLDDTAEVPEGSSTESWMHFETDQIPAQEQDAVAADVRRVLTDVRWAVNDAPALYFLIRDLADRIEADPGQFAWLVILPKAADVVFTMRASFGAKRAFHRWSYCRPTVPAPHW